MPKAKLEFDLPEDQDAFTLAIGGRDFWTCLWDLDNESRNFLKYGHSFKSADEVLEWVRQEIRNSGNLKCVS